MQLGNYRVETIVDAYFGLDGGAMFGIVPKPLWARANPADERNRIDLAARCLLIRGAGRCIVVETGMGDKLDEKRADIFALRPHAGGLVAQLRGRGIEPAEVTDVVLTHLHFDHCGGTTQRRGDGLALTFPEAVHHVQRSHWEWAQAPAEKDAGSFREEDFAVLDGDQRLHLVEGDGPLFDGVNAHVVGGHTPGMQMVSVDSDDGGLILCADLVPTAAHLRAPYIMAYDNHPLTTLAEKHEWLPRWARQGRIVVFGHDPGVGAAQLQVVDGRVAVDREIDLS